MLQPGLLTSQGQKMPGQEHTACSHTATRPGCASFMCLYIHSHLRHLAFAIARDLFVNFGRGAGVFAGPAGQQRVAITAGGF